jgi:hypothetical protein
MEILTQEHLNQIISEIQGSAEVSRRAQSDRRHTMYKDGGKKYLVEQLKREFDEQAVNEMRLCPINILKKIVNKRSVVYKVPPVRVSLSGEADQALIDYYTKELKLNVAMQKANRYYTLLANTALYVRPYGQSLKLDIVPPSLYSIVANPVDRTHVDAWVFSAFTEAGMSTPDRDLSAATGKQGFQRDAGFSTRQDLVESNENQETDDRRFIFWTDSQHFTTDGKANLLVLDPEKGDEQFINPIGVSPVVNLAKDRDNEPWATQFEDAVDLCLAIMLGWTDVLTVAKNQGFSILTIVSQEEPKQLKVGVNKAVWLRRLPDQEAPSISYVQANSPLGEYRALLLDLLAILLSSNDMPPNSVGGTGANRSFTSGFHALIEMSDTIEAVEADKPAMREAEEQLWQVIAKWHNWMLDMDMLAPEARSLGKFSQDFKIAIAFRDVKPIESESEIIASIKDLMSLRLITRKDALKRLKPDLSDEQLDETIKKIDDELGAMIADARKRIGQDEPMPTEEMEDEMEGEEVV